MNLCEYLLFNIYSPRPVIFALGPGPPNLFYFKKCLSLFLKLLFLSWIQYSIKKRCCSRFSECKFFWKCKMVASRKTNSLTPTLWKMFKKFHKNISFFYHKYQICSEISVLKIHSTILGYSSGNLHKRCPWKWSSLTNSKNLEKDQESCSCLR